MARRLVGLYRIQNGKVSEIVHFNEQGNAELTRQVIHLNANIDVAPAKEKDDWSKKCA